MALMKPNPFLADLCEDLWEREGATPAVDWIPAVDIVETDHEVTIKAEVPGMEAGELTLVLNENVLTLRGERQNEKGTSGENFQRMERASGSFSRSFTIPASIDESRVTAELKSGLLTITLPKLEGSKKRTIDVHAAKEIA